MALQLLPGIIFQVFWPSGRVERGARAVALETAMSNQQHRDPNLMINFTKETMHPQLHLIRIQKASSTAPVPY